MSGLHEISGQCHCGNVAYTFISPISKMELPIKGCDCSFCNKQGACYTSHPQGKLDVIVQNKEEVKLYRFGSESADVFLCTNCGAFPFIITELDNQLFAILNANSINGLQIDRAAIVPLVPLENQADEERTERWRRSWIPSVAITYLNQPVNPALL